MFAVASILGGGEGGDRPSSKKYWGKSVFSPPECFSFCVVTSVVNFEVSSCTKFQIFRGSGPDPAGGAYSAPPRP